MHIKFLTILITSVLALTACDEGGDSKSTEDSPQKEVPNSSDNGSNISDDTSDSSDDVPGGIYLGYYNEDAGNNPEDPTAGAYILNLPEKDGNFSGNMNFTYVGCQTQDDGNVNGIKSGLELTGQWSGQTDGRLQKGPYTGKYDSQTMSYSGNYSNSNGKNHMIVDGCIEYYVAAKGTWEMFHEGFNSPESFSSNYKSNEISWSKVDDAYFALAYVMSPEILKNKTGNAVLWQSLGSAKNASVDVPNMLMVPGKQYISVVVLFDENHKRLATSNTEFTY